MPHLRIETNLPKEKVPGDFLQKTVSVLAKALGKPDGRGLQKDICLRQKEKVHAAPYKTSVHKCGQTEQHLNIKLLQHVLKSTFIGANLDILKEKRRLVAEITTWPHMPFGRIKYCVVSVIPNTIMSFGGTSEPCAIANLMSIGGLGVEQNKKHSKVIFDLVEKELGVTSDRMYITFQDEPTGNVGFKGTTFHSIVG